MSGGATDVMRFCYAAILPFILFLPAAEALAETVNTRILNPAVELLPDESAANLRGGLVLRACRLRGRPDLRLGPIDRWRFGTVVRHQFGSATWRITRILLPRGPNVLGRQAGQGTS